ncbi:type III secretion system inner membrane ring subunit SctD [Rhabdochlamydiaceae symbiont of Dictyostelium giganteum]|uniref:type III secretion system inner membrane ring subunit SctD n=1 Tax=Rhabdochlamydiaceae symbiont of Dictyostelium giganteum TaxID=3342349 RepID=UPI003850600E
MSGYLIAEEGPLAGLNLNLEEGVEWIVGRDPDEVSIVLEDPMVSRKHAVLRLTPEGFTLENLSHVNPVMRNGVEVLDPISLFEGDLIQIGNTLFRFSEHQEMTESHDSFSFEQGEDLAHLSHPTSVDSRWMIKVASGPNSGAEFQMAYGKSYVIGKDAEMCDILLQDLSVSRQHAKIHVDKQGKLFIEDLDSRNKTVVRGEPVVDILELKSQDLVTLGTTVIMVIDQEQDLETMVSALPPSIKEEEEVTPPPREEPKEIPPQTWRDIILSKKQIALGILGITLLLTLFAGMISLFQEEHLQKPPKHESEQIQEITANYPAIQFSYNEGSRKLFITGHVLLPVEKQELIYQLSGLSFLNTLDDQSVVIDELVWENMNALLMTNPEWQGVSIFSKQPGKFIIRGYLQTAEESQNLTDYLNINFPYLDKLENEVIIESTLLTQIQSLLLDKGFNNVAYQLMDGDLILSGRIDAKDSAEFDLLTLHLKQLSGIKDVKNYVVSTNESSSLVDLSAEYRITGFSKKDGENQFVVINGKILTLGDFLDGMVITAISPSMIFLEKDGLKFKIHYNLQ